MVRVSKCCCFFNLKYGFFTFAVISLLLRVCVATSLYFGITLETSRSKYPGYIVETFGVLIGWYSTTAALLSIALKGIIQRKQLLLYPYIVVLIVEIIPAVIFFLYIIWTAPLIEALWPLVYFLVTGSINSYAALCLVSLSFHFKYSEGRRPPLGRGRDYLHV